MTAESQDVPPKFVIVTLPRSGSYHLVSLLDSAPDVVCHGEVFKRDAVELAAIPLGKMGITEKDVQLRDEKPAQFLNRLRNLNGRKIVGFKMFPEHATRLKPLKDHVLMNRNWRKVFLTRNPVESYASLLRAKATGLWTARAGSANARSERLDSRITFAADSFDEHMRMCDWFEAQEREIRAVAGNPCLTLDYRDVTDRSGLERLLRFIGSSTSADALRSEYVKQYSGRFSDGFTNWEQLVAYARAQGRAAALEGLD